jgi:hypothetical protein
MPTFVYIPETGEIQSGELDLPTKDEVWATCASSGSCR